MTIAMRFTVAEFDRMIEQGIFGDRPNTRFELIHGEVREMSPSGPSHDYVIDLLMYWSFDKALRDKVHFRIQNCLGIPVFDSVPMPDVALMKARNYREHRPEPLDVLLLIEVSDSSLQGDRREKAALYAGAGIKDYWIVNLNGFCVEVRRRPKNGEYQSIESFGIGQSVAPLAFPDASLNVADLFK